MKNELLKKNKTASFILSIIKINPAVTIPELMEKSRKSRTTVQNCLKLLKDEKIIKRIGANKGGSWDILL